MQVGIIHSRSLAMDLQELHGRVLSEFASGRQHIFVATDELILEEKRQVAQRRGLPLDNNGKPWPWVALLAPGAYRRLMDICGAWGAMAEDKPSTLFCSLTQNLEFTHCPRNGAIPALIRNSFIYRIADGDSIHKERPAVPIEYLAMQAIPVLLPEGHLFGAVWPQSELAKLPAHVIRSMSGNGMNLVAVGSVLMFSLGCLEL